MKITLHSIIFNIEVECNRYQYRINPNGTRDIDTNFPVQDSLQFRWDLDALKLIIFRDGPNVLSVDRYKMYFDHDESNNLIGIHFEDNSHIWIVSGWKEFLNICIDAYCKMIYSTTTYNEPYDNTPLQMETSVEETEELDLDDDDDDIIDEFDFEEL